MAIHSTCIRPHGRHVNISKELQLKLDRQKENRDRVYYYYDRLFELRQNNETITYAEIGAEQNQFHRHVSRSIGLIHISIDVYNRLNNLNIPHIVALVVNKKTKKPGVGCDSSPHDVLKFTDYQKHKEPIKKILSFILNPSYAYVFKENDWVTKFCELLGTQQNEVHK